MSKKWIFGVSVSALISITTPSIAGSMGDSSAASFNGFWLGAGGSYTYSTLNGDTNITQVSSAPSSNQYVLSNNILNHMAPIVNAGYYFTINHDWMVGPKFLYKYIGQEQFDQTWSGTYQDGSYQSAGIRSKSMQNFYLLLSGGYQFDQWLVHAGVGPGWANVDLQLNGSLLTATSLNATPINTTKSKTMIGGAGQVGFEYMLPHHFMVDISYNFLATPETMLPNIIFQSSNGNYAKFSQRVNVVEQGINITVNKYFG